LSIEVSTPHVLPLLSGVRSVLTDLDNDVMELDETAF
jgi:hypothetical protein